MFPTQTGNPNATHGYVTNLPGNQYQPRQSSQQISQSQLSFPTPTPSQPFVSSNNTPLSNYDHNVPTQHSFQVTNEVSNMQHSDNEIPDSAHPWQVIKKRRRLNRSTESIVIDQPSISTKNRYDPIASSSNQDSNQTQLDNNGNTRKMPKPPQYIFMALQIMAA
ncbi:hypothetical protein PPYR_13924 [Photinus pyralis]|uniref:Uncharacterized protein n=1 Tax=Photinus pyralis TaxID=7054 RepID=A0A1Y1KIT9_PHOPY|nr:hypothetical protein PPYR_13924 [Photinus pyralis]